MGMAAPHYYSAEMVRALPDDGNRYEAVHGELLVTPSPRLLHQLIVGRLHTALATYLQEQPVGVLLAAPADISWGADTLVQPDLFVAPVDEVRTLDWRQLRHLLLVAEVLSPATARYDRFTKRRLYQEVRVPWYWVVDPATEHIEVWTPSLTFPSIERETLEWHPEGATRAFRLRVEDLFRRL